MVKSIYGRKVREGVQDDAWEVIIVISFSDGGINKYDATGIIQEAVEICVKCEFY